MVHWIGARSIGDEAARPDRGRPRHDGVRPRTPHAGQAAPRRQHPVVDVHIIYEGKYEQLNADGLLGVLSEVADKAYYEVDDDLGFPCPSFFAKSEMGRRDLATV